MLASPDGASQPPGYPPYLIVLKAEERETVWHIAKRDAPRIEIVSFSREDGKVLSSDP